ncbi:MAG: GNAT family N-acetyltransferase [Acidobacteriota bacterium]|nr:GNAT family N-acetyltransferase [Acidobacteriota bacterium]
MANASQIEIRPLTSADLESAARVHLAAFPESALTALGLESVRRYYDWQLTGPHDALAISAWCNGEFAGFCFGGVFRGAMSGFLQRNRLYLAWRVLTHPWLALNPLFRDRLVSGLNIYRRFRGSAKTPTTTKAAAQPRFGILAIAVNPKFQGFGVGKQLMQVSETAARERGFTLMQLSVNTENFQAIKFYESLGWQKSLVQEIWKGEMLKPLTERQ